MNYEEWKKEQEIRSKELKLAGDVTSKSIIMRDLIRSCDETQRFDHTKAHTEQVPKNDIEMKECPKCKGEGALDRCEGDCREGANRICNGDDKGECVDGYLTCDVCNGEGEIEMKEEPLIKIMTRVLQETWVRAPEYNKDTVKRLVANTLKVLNRRVTKGRMTDTLARMFCVKRNEYDLINKAFTDLFRSGTICYDEDKYIVLRNNLKLATGGIVESQIMQVMQVMKGEHLHGSPFTVEAITQTAYDSIRVRRIRKKYEVSNEEVHVKRGKRQRVKYTNKIVIGDLV